MDTLTIRPARMDDAEALFEWRNDQSAREHYTNSSTVTWDEHRAWLTRSLAGEVPGRAIYIVERNGIRVGMIRVDEEDGHAELSYVVAQAERGKGIGKAMVLQFAKEHLAGQKIRARIKKGHAPSESLAKALGLVQVGEAPSTDPHDARPLVDWRTPRARGILSRVARHPEYALAAVAALVWGVVFAYFFLLTSGFTPRFPVLEHGDSIAYVHLAEGLAHFGYYGYAGMPADASERIWPIGYPLFLALFGIGSGSFLVASAVQAALGILSVILLYRMGASILPRPYAFTAALLYAVSPATAFHTVAAATDGLFAALLIIVVYLLFYVRDRRILFALLAGVMLGFAILVRPIGGYLIVLLPFWYPFIRRESPRRILIILGVFIAGALLVLMPWMTRNLAMHGSFSIAENANYNLLQVNARNFLITKLGSEQAADDAIDGLRAEAPAAADRELAGRIILAEPVSYGVFHLSGAAASFLTGGGWREFLTRRESILRSEERPVRTVSVREALVRARDCPLCLDALGPLALVAVDTFYRLAIVALALCALLSPRRILPHLFLWFLLAAYFALLVGAFPRDVRFHLPGDPYLYLAAASGAWALASLVLPWARRHGYLTHGLPLSRRRVSR